MGAVLGHLDILATIFNGRENLAVFLLLDGLLRKFDLGMVPVCFGAETSCVYMAVLFRHSRKMQPELPVSHRKIGCKSFADCLDSDSD